MKRSALLLGSIACVLLVVLTGGFVVADTVIESVHSTNSDFQDGTVDNLTIQNDQVTWEYSAGDRDLPGQYISNTHTGSAEEAYVDVSITNLEATVEWQYQDGSGSWVTYDSTTVDGFSDGVVTTPITNPGPDAWRVVITVDNPDQLFSGNEAFYLNEEGISYTTTNPEISNAQPTDGEEFTNRSPTISFDVSHEDFDSSHVDSVDVSIYLNGNEEYTETISSDSTIEWEASNVALGENEWYAVATDNQGNSVTSATRTFSVPAELELRNASSPSELVTDNSGVRVTFFGSDEVVTRNVTDGTVDLTGLPADEEFAVQVENSNFVTRQTIIRSIYDQQEIYLLPTSAETVSTQFELRDPTGQMQQSNSRILVQKPIERSGTTEWVTVAADDMGPGGFSTLLERDQRYKILVEDLTTGQQREMGPYIATEPRTVVLEVDQIDFEFGDADAGYQWSAAWLNETEPAIDFAFEAENGISELTVRIVERGGNETVVLDETWTDMTTIQHREIIPDGVANKNTSSYSVEWEATFVNANGDEVTLNGSTIVGPNNGVDPPGVPQRILSMVGIFLILMVAGLFSYANVGVGGVVTSLFAGMLWFLGVIPGSVSGLAIGFALLISSLWMVRQSRGPL